MPLGRVKSRDPGQLAVNDAGRQAFSKVGNDGRINVNFHFNPKELAEYFKGFHDLFSEKANKRRPQRPRKTSNAFLDDKVAQTPRLNIAIHIVGSRGDVQPFIPIAQLLSKPPFGHRVRICTHPVFKDFVESNGVEFFSIGGDPEALMAYMVKNPGLLPSTQSFKAGDVGKRRKEMTEIIHGVWRSCIEAGNGLGPRVTAADVPDVKDLFIADAIIANPPSMGHIHCAEKLGIPLHMVFTMPWSPTQVFPHPLASMSYGEGDARYANYLSYMAMELLTWQGLGDLINKFRTRTLRLDPISPLWGHQLLPRLRVPFTYLWSQSLIPKPRDWDSHINIAGFSFLKSGSSYTPPADLMAFLDAGPPPVYIGFGSIVVDDPESLTQLIFEAVKLAKVRAIVSKGWGGVGGTEVPNDIFLLGNCPHDWLFPRVAAVVHHGGAGTTAAGISAGRPTVVVPFFGDQPFWGKMISRAGAGPVPVPFKEMTAETLANSITFALKPEVQEAVEEMAKTIGDEDGAGGTANDVQERLDIEDMRCDICPERVALWRHKKTGAHLSSFAATSLVNANVSHPSDFKLLRRKHWYVDEGPESPTIGTIAAITSFFTSIGIATSEFSYRLRTPPPPRPRKDSYIPGLATDEEETPTWPFSKTASRVQGAPPKSLGIKKMQSLAVRMASKTLKPGRSSLGKELTPTFHERGKMKWKAREQGEHGRAYYVTRASASYVGHLTKAVLKAPTAYFYNVANGFHNHPSYVWNDIQVRRRDEIKGVGSGLKVAGKEFVFGFYDAFSGIVLQPYICVKRDGPKGIGMGLLRAADGFFYNIGAAAFGLPGYTMKGLEKELTKRHMTKLTAELMLVRLRQGLEDCIQATQAEREEVVIRWAQLLKC
ncbi:UDP-Glycosyltransferase/glycogen phosphorylase [Paramyrothecium foliicola]|nr:UDP-Glycosyltransferase/glycogen phosphorylase [Paramyrothecium foliicola]